MRPLIAALALGICACQGDPHAGHGAQASSVAPTETSPVEGPLMEASPGEPEASEASQPEARETSPSPPALAPGTAEASRPPEAAPAGLTVAVAVTAEGFSPARIALPGGVASRLVFTRTSEATCATSVQSAALGIPETPLPLGQAVVVEVRPERGAEASFACGMDMVTGVVVAQ